MRKRTRLRLVTSHDASNVFDDLDKLREKRGLPQQKQRRKNSPETFARLPHDRALELYQYHLTNAAWIVLIELDRIILRHRGQNPVRFISSPLRAMGLTHHTRKRALEQLAATGIIKVEYEKSGHAPWVTHSWFPLCD